VRRRRLAAGRPASFHKLTRQVYARLNERWEPYPAEADAMELINGQPKALDRALFALAKRRGGHDAAPRARVEREMIAANLGLLGRPSAASSELLPS
jgi:hypothetical protein